MRSTPMKDISVAPEGGGCPSALTFMSHAHFGLHGLEVISDIRLDFSAHALACPLLEAADSLVDVHGGFGSESRRG